MKEASAHATHFCFTRVFHSSVDAGILPKALNFTHVMFNWVKFTHVMFNWVTHYLCILHCEAGVETITTGLCLVLHVVLLEVHQQIHSLQTFVVTEL